MSQEPTQGIESGDDQATPDRCPFCLVFEGRAAALAEGCYFCPQCGADWRSLEHAPDADPARVLPAEDRFDPGEDEAFPADEDTPLPGAAETSGPPPGVGDAVILGAPIPEPPAERRSLFGPATVGVLLGVAVALALAFVLDHTGSTGDPRASVARVPALPTRTRKAPEPPLKKVSTRAAPEKSAPEKPPETATPPPLPSAPDEPERRAEAVLQAIRHATRDLPPVARVEVEAKVVDGIAFLRGGVDSKATADAVASAAAEVFGVRAVDTRAVKIVYRHHELASGETLIGLAQRYYDDPNAWVRIWAANAGVATRPDRIRVGTKLLIPTE